MTNRGSILSLLWGATVVSVWMWFSNHDILTGKYAGKDTEERNF